jgi:hypothetical protein
MNKFFLRLRDWFSLDTRSLAVGRMGLGLFIFIDILWRLSFAEWHYTDLGVMPRDVFTGQFAYPWSFSLHLANGSLGFAVLMLSLHGLCALAMMLGWHTRLATALVAILTISLHNRNWYLNNGGDDALRAFMILATFIPWGEKWSMDQWRHGNGQKKTRRISGTWVFSWFLQIFVIYFVSYILKTSPIWRSEYTAIYYSSHLDIFATDLSRFLRQFPGPMKVATFLTIMLEWMGPLVLIAGWMMARRFQGKLRLLTVLSFWGLHIGIILTMSIGLFPFYLLAVWSTFIPSSTWDYWLSRFPAIDFRINSFYARLAGGPTQVQGERVAGPKIKWASQSLGGFIFLVIMFWNLSTLKPPLKVQIPFWISVGRWTHLYQEWNMFAPFPKQENLWIEIPAVLEDGSSLELLSNSTDVLSSKELTFPATVPNEHWRKYLMNMSDNDKIARHYGGAWCRLWNRPVSSGGREPKLRNFSINIYHHVIQADYVQSPMMKKTIWNHWCFDKDYKSENK